MSNDSSATIVSKVWNYAHVLKNAGVGYGDYVEQITYLLFLKLADEMTELGFDNPIPAEFQWSELSSKSGDEFEVHYRIAENGVAAHLDLDYGDFAIRAVLDYLEMRPALDCD